MAGDIATDNFNVKSMVKILSQLSVPIEDAWLTAACHFGSWGTWEPDAVHCIYYYQSLLIPPDVTAYHFHDTESVSILEAKLWLVMPQLVKDMCIACRSMALGPNMPRYNIYRGEDQRPVPPCIWWDIKTGDPPWPGS